jgi:hypothetical protein
MNLSFRRCAAFSETNSVSYILKIGKKMHEKTCATAREGAALGADSRFLGLFWPAER